MPGWLLVLGLLIVLGIQYAKQTQTTIPADSHVVSTPPSLLAPETSDHESSNRLPVITPQPSPPAASSAPLTPAVSEVVDFLRQHGHLPPQYLTKEEARRLGWDPQRGNLSTVAPGKLIGGDRFMNREGKLPEATGRRWFEADINYTGGYRGSDRLLYSSDGLIYLTLDHYRTFTPL